MEPEHHLREFADRTARSILEAGRSDMLYRMQMSGLLGAGAAPRSPATAGKLRSDSREERVGIWARPTGTTGAFVRAPATMADWPLWAGVGRIEPKKSRRRVVLIGESVARGWFYQPHYTPALVLNAMLGSVLAPQTVEVIDLARTDLTLEVRELAFQAEKLEPDAVVIFAGNNWRAGLPEVHIAREYEAALAQGGVPALRRYFDSELESAATRVVTDVSAHYAKAGVPVIWVVPEFNLADWRDWRVNATYLGDRATREWLENADGAVRATGDGQYSRARAMATRMIELDGGTNALGLRVLADCAQRDGDVAHARELLERARDACIWDLSHQASPRPYAVSQAAIRTSASRFRCPVVDMPSVFAEYLHGALPDRRLFTDYCHLTDEGIRVAMASVAATTIEALTKRKPSARQLLANAPQPVAKVKAEAAFLAAIHNAHWWQPAGIVKHHCAKALDISPHVAEIMMTFAEIQGSAAPMLLSAAAERLSKLGGHSIPHYILRRNTQQLDALLLGSIAEALSEHGRDVRQRFSHMLQFAHSVARGRCNLLSFYFQASGEQAQELSRVLPGPSNSAAASAPDYFRAYGTESRFAFVSEANVAVELSITLRIPNVPAGLSRSVSMHVNGVRVGTLEATQRWSTHSVCVPEDAVEDGINRVALEWPMPSTFQSVVERSIAREYLCGRKDALFTVFGEVHTLQARVMREVASAAAR
jgi:hypothetical protein